MKKIVFFLIMFCCLFASISVSAAQSTSKLSFQGKVYSINEFIYLYGNTYLANALEFSTVTGIKYELGKTQKDISITYKEIKKVYPIKILPAAPVPNNSNLSTPVLISNKLYFPLSFIRTSYKLDIKFNTEKNSIYILPVDTSSKYLIKEFANINNNYTLSLTDAVNLSFNNTSSQGTDESITIQNKNNLFKAVIHCEKLDKEVLSKLRLFLNDNSSTEDELFEKFLLYNNSYLGALKDSYKKEFLFGNNNGSEEGNMKVFGSLEEKIFGQNSNIFIYNTIHTNKSTSVEEVHIDLSVPVSTAKTVYNIRFTVNKENMNAECLKRISDFMNSLQISKLPKQVQPLSSIIGKDIIALCSAGIYPEFGSSGTTYAIYANEKIGYKIKYPSTLLPHMQNSIADYLDFQSFKINYNHSVSIAAEPLIEGQNDVSNKTSFLKDSYGSSMYIEEDTTKKISGKDYTFIKYVISTQKDNTYYQDYFMVNGSYLYTVRLTSRFVKPASKIQAEFNKIVSSLELFDASNNATVLEDPLSKYVNKEEGYSFQYPSNWQLSETLPVDIYYDSLMIKDTGASGSADIRISEGELFAALPPQNIFNLSSAESSDEINRLYKKYSAPYLDKDFRLLSHYYHIKDGAIYIERLVNYLEEGDRYKICYSKDIIRGSKVYSVFVTASDYDTVNGQIMSEKSSAILKLAVDSFCLEDTLDLSEREKSGETRNWKVVYIEDHFKKSLGSNVSVESAVYDDFSGNTLVTLEGSIESAGFYNLQLDFNNRKIDVIDNLRKNDIFNTVQEKLQLQYHDKSIQIIEANQNNMAIDVEFQNTSLSPTICKTYKIKVNPSLNKLSYHFEAEYPQDSIKTLCNEYLGNLLASNTETYYEYDEEYYHQDKYLIPVFVKNNGQSVYYILTLNPINDEISMVSSVNLSDIFKKAGNLYTNDSRFDVAGIQIDETDMFKINVFLRNIQNQQFKLETHTVYLNKDKLTLDLTK